MVLNTKQEQRSFDVPNGKAPLPRRTNGAVSEVCSKGVEGGTRMWHRSARLSLFSGALGVGMNGQRNIPNTQDQAATCPNHLRRGIYCIYLYLLSHLRMWSKRGRIFRNAGSLCCSFAFVASKNLGREELVKYNQKAHESCGYPPNKIQQFFCDPLKESPNMFSLFRRRCVGCTKKGTPTA